MLKPSRWLVVFLFALGVGAALAARNSSGTYSLPAGNPFIPGTTISSSTMNGNFSDVSTELTNSLDRQGRGAMLAPLQLTNGTNLAPGLAFASEPGSGFYRAGVNDLRWLVNQIQVCRMQPAAVTFNVATTSSASFAATNSTAGGAGITATGNGTGTGITATGGATSGVGGTFVGGAPNGVGVSGTGAGAGAGGTFAAGTAATGATPQNAVTLSNGYLGLDGVTAPASTTAVKNAVTPKNVVKAWGEVTATSTAALADGFNVASVSGAGGGGDITVTLAQAMSNSNYAVLATVESSGAGISGGGCKLFTKNASSFVIRCYDSSGATIAWGNTTTAGVVSFLVLGAQ